MILPPPNPDDTLSALSDEEVKDLYVSLQLICSRNHAVLKSKRRGFLCNLTNMLTYENTKRGQSNPVAPYHGPL